MSPVYHKSRRGLDRIDTDVSAEGLAIMLAQPSRVMRAVILALAALLIALLAWSFYGRADVIVSAKGIINPEQEQIRVYVPLKGELVELYVVEGQPVRKGDLLARLNSLDAIQMVGRAQQAQMALKIAEQNYRTFPAKLETMKARVEMLEAQVRANEADYDLQREEGMAKLGDQQRLKLEKARSKYERAAEQREHARQVMEQHRRLFNDEFGGGIAEKDVVEKQKEFREKEIDADLARMELGEFEVKLGEEFAKKQDELRKKYVNVLNDRHQLQRELIMVDEEKIKMDTELSRARSDAELAARIKHEDIDENDFLRIVAPDDGIVTRISQTQRGAKIDEKTPLLALAPDGARKVLEVEVDQQHAALLKVGMPVRMKIDAFTYLQYGTIEGRLEFIADAAFYNRDTKRSVYKARIGMDRTHFDVNNEKVPVRYGMMGTAELVVRQRRLIDIALDPIRNITAG